MTHPNILFIMTDQQRWDAMSCAGDWVRTPNLDRIAAEGVRFSYCVTTTPICIPARVTLATGHYPHNNNVWDNITYAMPEDVKTWMRAIRDLGYRTSMFGKTHLHPHRGDLREREHLINAYGLDDVDEIGGPRASAAVMSHMTQDVGGEGTPRELSGGLPGAVRQQAPCRAPVRAAARGLRGRLRRPAHEGVPASPTTATSRGSAG